MNFYDNLLESSEWMEKKMKSTITTKAWEVIDLTTDKIVKELVRGNYNDSFLDKLKLDVVEEVLKSQFDRLLDAGKYFRYLLGVKIIENFRDKDTDDIDYQSINNVVGDSRKFVALQFVLFLEKIMTVYIKKIEKEL